jgi:heptaprenyl diphosphate synthase
MGAGYDAGHDKGRETFRAERTKPRLFAAGGAEDRLRNRLARMEDLFRTRFAGKGPDDPEAEMGRRAYEALMSGGKRLRPGLASLASGFGKPAEDAIVDVMAAVEIIHTASLIHDDIVDDSDERRGRPTINALKGDGYAARCGYFLIAEAVNILEAHMRSGVTDILADVVTDMCRGELRQLRIESDLAMQSPDDYFARIERKTARLIEGSCRMGCRIGDSRPDRERTLGEYGGALGIVFQLRDDLLDCGLVASGGKPVYQDLRRGVYTLPVLYAVRRSRDARLPELLAKKDKSRSEMAEIIAYAEETGGVAYAKEMIAAYAARALNALTRLPDIDERDLLYGTVLNLCELDNAGVARNRLWR